jgi:uncharacterized membrane protein
MNKIICAGQFSIALPLAIFWGQPFTHVIGGIVPPWIPGRFFWSYLAGTALFFTALGVILKKETAPGSGLDRVIPVGRLFLAFPMAVFGVEHLIYADFCATLVPSWIPGHLFWTYFTGIALIAAALSITVKVQARLASTLLGIMIFLFVLLVSVPKVFSTPGDRFVWSAGLRDLALSASALIFAATQTKAWSQEWQGPERRWFITVARFFIAIPVLVFGVQHFIYPDFVPGIPVNKPMPLWIPGHLFWSYFTGAAFIAASVSLMIEKEARLAASLLTGMLLVWLLVIYIPIWVADPHDTGYALVNVAMHLALSGGTLILAGTQTKEAAVDQSSALAETALVQS